MKKKTILFITYYWPPFGSPALTRILNFVKYLHQIGWEIIILTPKIAATKQIDHNLEKSIPESVIVYKTNIIEKRPKPSGLSGINVLTDKNMSFSSKIKLFIRLNFFIPDAKIGWIPFAIKEGKKIILKHQPDIIFSTSPPPSVNLIAKALKKWSKLPWVADFRDPWTNIYYLQDKKYLSFSKKKNEKLEREALQQSDLVSVVNNGFFKEKLEKQIEHKKLFLPNGYDPDHFENEVHPKNKIFTIRYLGSYKSNQFSEGIFEAFRRLTNQLNVKFKVEFYGSIAPKLYTQLHSFQSENLIIEHKGIIDKMAAYHKMKTSDVLFMIVGKAKENKFIVSTKIFEYLASNKPILANGPLDGAANKILIETKAGKMFEYNDIEGMVAFLQNNYVQWRDDIEFSNDRMKVEQFSAAAQVKRLDKVLLRLINT